MLLYLLDSFWVDGEDFSFGKLEYSLLFDYCLMLCRGEIYGNVLKCAKAKLKYIC